MAEGEGGGQPADSATHHCPTLGQKRPLNAPPCDLKTIVGQIALRGDRIVSKQNSARKAAEVPPAGLSAGEAKLLEEHAVVIVHHVGYGASQSGAPSSSESVSEMTTTVYKANASARVRATEHCAIHPSWSSESEDEPGGGEPLHGFQSKAQEIKLEALELTVPAFLKRLFHGKLYELVKPAETACAFDFWSCGWPSQGDPVGELTAHVGMRALDDWKFSFRWLQGFSMEFGKTSTHIRHYGDGSSVTETKSKSVKKGEGGETTNTLVSQGDDPTLYRQQHSDDEKADVQWESKSDPGSIEALRRRKDESGGVGSKIGEKFEKLGDKLDSLTLKDGLSITIVRNGKDQFNGDELAETIEKIKKFIETALDLVYRVMLIQKTACKVGIPVSVSFSFEVDLRALQGTLEWRRWDKELAPVEGGAYYLCRSQAHWDLGFELTILSGSFQASIEFQARLVHEWVAAITVTIEAKFKGEAKCRIKTNDTIGGGDFGAGGLFWATATATGEASALTCYVQASAEGSSGIEYGWRGTISGPYLKVKKNRVHSRRLGLQLSARYGNKVWDFLGLGSEDPDWQWPKDGPFVLIEEGAIDENLQAGANE